MESLEALALISGKVEEEILTRNEYHQLQTSFI